MILKIFLNEISKVSSNKIIGKKFSKVVSLGQTNDFTTSIKIKEMRKTVLKL